MSGYCLACHCHFAGMGSRLQFRVQKNRPSDLESLPILLSVKRIAKERRQSPQVVPVDLTEG